MLKEKDKLDSRMIEHIAIGVSFVAKCQPCLQYHVKEARKLGSSDIEIEAVIKLARKIRAMSDQKMDEFVGIIFNADDTVGVAEECGCASGAKKENCC